MPILQNFTRRAQIKATSATQVNFAASDLTRRPIVLTKDGRFAELTVLPSALTISGSAGIYWIYADLGAPSGNGWRETTVGFITRLINATTPNRADWWTPLTFFLPRDTTMSDANHSSAITLVQSGAAPSTETTQYRLPLGYLTWSGTAIKAVHSFEGDATGLLSLAGQCRLVKSGSNLRLVPYNGDGLWINGQLERVPNPGVDLAPTSLSTNTNYYVYAKVVSSEIALEASTTGPVLHSDGTYVKTGDPTRALVGLARTITGPAWVDTDAQRFVLSWFNRRSIRGKNFFTADRTTTSTTAVEVHTEIRVEFLTWAEESVYAGITGSASNSSAGGFVTSGVALDGATPEAQGTGVSPAANDRHNIAVAARASLAEGYHYATLSGRVNTGTGKWDSVDGQTVSLCRVYVETLG
jgi:hypothetical protein